MRDQHRGKPIDRRGFVTGAALAGATAVASTVTAKAAAPTGVPHLRLAQAGGTAPVTGTPAGITIKAVERLVGSSVSYAYAVKAGPWIFLNGHEAYDFEKGLAPEVEGPRGYRLAGRPPLRREADYILRRMRTILKEFGSDLPNAVRVDQYYTMARRSRRITCHASPSSRATFRRAPRSSWIGASPGGPTRTPR